MFSAVVPLVLLPPFRSSMRSRTSMPIEALLSTEAPVNCANAPDAGRCEIV